MPRIEPIGMAAATGKAKELLGELASRGSEPEPMVRAVTDEAPERDHDLRSAA